MSNDTTVPDLETGWRDRKVYYASDRKPLRGWISSPYVDPDENDPSVVTSQAAVPARINNSHSNELLSTLFPVRRRHLQARIAGFQSKADEVWRETKWKGHVTEILDDGFVAEFQSPDLSRQLILAEFDFDELSKGDQRILAVGRPIVWAVFTERRKGGLQNDSALYLRRPSSPSASEIDHARASLDEWFGGSQDITTSI